MKELKLGSLFDGSGGFPLAGVMHGIRPVWASEIEPFPIRVTKLRFPDMKHLGSVTDINGAEVEPVDIITFGSPCQDLSVAGQRAGIHDGERSNLFFEAVRIIKEMRDATTNQFPRFAVWENVPGAFSSNNGGDFRAVLKALCSVCDEHADVPGPSDGAWQSAGCVLGNGWSVAWRLYDAQYWGVPQRRKRIYLVADFASERAGEILFESEGMSGDSEPGREAREGTAADAEGSVGRGSWSFKERAGKPVGGKGFLPGYESAFTLNTNADQSVAFTCETMSHDVFSTKFCKDGKADTLAQTDYKEPPIVSYGIDQQGGKGNASYGENVMPSLCSDSHGTPHAVCFTPEQNHCRTYREDTTSATLETKYHYGSGGDAVAIVHPIDQH